MEIFRKWLFLLRIPLVLLGVILAFVLYSRFLLNRNVQNLKTSLSILDKASGVGQAEAALLLVDQTLVSQMAQEELDLKTVATLQYTQSVLASDQKQRPVEDTQAMLTLVEEEQTSEQSGFFRSLDGLVAGAQDLMRRTALLPRQTLGRSLSPQMDQAGLAEAARLERLGLLPEAARAYEQLLTRYPNYSGGSTLKLRLGQICQRLQDFPRAARTYQEAARLARNSSELAIAQQMQQQVAQIQKKAAALPALEKKLAKAASGEDRQRLAAELGGRLIEIGAMEKAAAAYHEAAAAFPGEKTSTYLFKEAWCLRSAGRMEEAFRKFADLIQREPKGAWAAACYQQMAEMYKASGNYEGATQAYEQAIAKGDDPMAAVVHAQAGSTYLYDLQNTEKAYAHFHDLEVRYPASASSTTLKQLQDLHQEKRTTPPAAATPLIPAGPTPGPDKPPVEDLDVGALGEGSPLMGWMEKFLPVFVDVFTGRLEKYLTATKQTKMKRQFTEAEFKDLVVREVQRRFPGQISNINAKIKAEGFIGSGTVRLGLLSVPVEAQIGIVVIKERPHAIVREIKVAKVKLPAPLLKLLESRVNASIDQAKYPLKVKEYTLKDGYALISVELAR